MGAALFNRPAGFAVGANGSIFIADSANNAIRVIENGAVYTFAGGETAGHVNGRLYAARFNQPRAIAIGPCGNLFVADTLNHVIRRISEDGNVTTIAGTPGVFGMRNGAAGTAAFDSPMGIVVCPAGRIFVADTGNHLIRVIENGEVRTLAGTVVLPAEPGFDNYPLGGFADGFAAMFGSPTGLAFWGENLIVADSMNHKIRAVLPTGETITLAGTGYPGYLNTAPASASFHLPSGLYVRNNRLYIADTGNNLIRTMELRTTDFDIVDIVQDTLPPDFWAYVSPGPGFAEYVEQTRPVWSFIQPQGN